MTPHSQRESVVFRTKPLPRGDLQGRFLVSEDVIDATRKGLESFAHLGVSDGGHEGIVFWCGRESEADTIVIMQAIVPVADHSLGRVMVSREDVGTAARTARAHGLGILAQVHSHPGDDVRHSDGDDNLVLLPFDGMLSVVVPSYGLGFRALKSAGVHQYRTNRWIWCHEVSVDRGIIVVPSGIDLR